VGKRVDESGTMIFGLLVSGSSNNGLVDQWVNRWIGHRQWVIGSLVNVSVDQWVSGSPDHTSVD